MGSQRTCGDAACLPAGRSPRSTWTAVTEIWLSCLDAAVRPVKPGCRCQGDIGRPSNQQFAGRTSSLAVSAFVAKQICTRLCLDVHRGSAVTVKQRFMNHCQRISDWRSPIKSTSSQGKTPPQADLCNKAGTMCPLSVERKFYPPMGSSTGSETGSETGSCNGKNGAGVLGYNALQMRRAGLRNHRMQVCLRLH